MDVTENMMETAVNGAAAAVANAINNAAPAIDLAVPDVKLRRPSGTSRSSSPTRSSMMSRSIARGKKDTIPVHTSGVVTVAERLHHRLRQWSHRPRRGPQWRLDRSCSGAAETGAGVRGCLARTPLFAFGELYRAAIHPHHLLDRFGSVDGAGNSPLRFSSSRTSRSWASGTNENRWGALQVIAADSAGITLRYRVREVHRRCASLLMSRRCVQLRRLTVRRHAVHRVGGVATAHVCVCVCVRSRPAWGARYGAEPEVPTAPSIAQLAGPDARDRGHDGDDGSAMEVVGPCVGGHQGVPERPTAGSAPSPGHHAARPTRFDARTSASGWVRTRGGEIDGIELVGQNGTIDPDRHARPLRQVGAQRRGHRRSTSVAFDMQIAVTVADDQVRTASARSVHSEPTCPAGHGHSSVRPLPPEVPRIDLGVRRWGPP